MRFILLFFTGLLATLTASAHGISDADKQGILDHSKLAAAIDKSGAAGVQKAIETNVKKAKPSSRWRRN